MFKKKKLKKKIGIFGGTFDPPHKGHIQIANFSLKKLNLDYLIWSITNKNPLKKKPMLSIKTRTYLCKKMTSGIQNIKIKNFDASIKSSKTIDLLKFMKQKHKGTMLYFIIGSDNLLNLHKWQGWKKFQDFCKIVIFTRQGYFKKTAACKAYKYLDKTKLIFIRTKITNISSSQIRKNYLLYK